MSRSVVLLIGVATLFFSNAAWAHIGFNLGIADSYVFDLARPQGGSPNGVDTGNEGTISLEVVWRYPHVEIGFFGDDTIYAVSGGSPGQSPFFGWVVRFFTHPQSGLAFALKLDPFLGIGALASASSRPSGNSSLLAYAWGVGFGVGYKFAGKGGFPGIEPELSVRTFYSPFPFLLPATPVLPWDQLLVLDFGIKISLF